MEIFTLVTGIAYIILEIRQKRLMWIVGVVTALAAMYMFFIQGLYASLALNAYYFVVSFWGLYQWRKDEAKLSAAGRCPEGFAAGTSPSGASPAGASPSGASPAGTFPAGASKADAGNEGKDVIHLNRLGWGTVAGCAAVFASGCILLHFVLGFLGDSMTDLDAAVAMMSAVATYMLSRSYLQQWLLWIVADALSAVLCATQGMWWMTVLYVLYTASAAYGYIYWRRRGVYLDDAQPLPQSHPQPHPQSLSQPFPQDTAKSGTKSTVDSGAQSTAESVTKSPERRSE
ncbi:MAG: nicotinamide riboside transporter PnuC [Candidatus Cryptobacteroides sp.]